MNEPSPVAAEPAPSPSAWEGAPASPRAVPEGAAAPTPIPVPSSGAGDAGAPPAPGAEPVVPDAASDARPALAPSAPGPTRADPADATADAPGTPAPAAPGAGGIPDDPPAGPATAPAVRAETMAEPPAVPAPASGPEPAAPSAPATDTVAEPPKIGVDVRFIDFAGQPIADLWHKITWTEHGKRIEFPGKTDARGQGLRIFSMAMHTRFELRVRKDDGSYVVKHRGAVSCENLSLCVVSPHIRIQVATELHAGPPGTLPPKPAVQDARVEKRPNAPVGRTADGAVPEAALRSGRDAQGHPVVTSTVPSKDANDRHRLPTFALWAWHSFIDRFRDSTMPAKVPAAAAPAAPASPTPAPSEPTNSRAVAAGPGDAAPRGSEPSATPGAPRPQARTASKADLKRVQKLIDCMEEQARWDWAALKGTYGTSAAIKNALANRTFNFSVAQKDEKRFTGNCYMSVKVGLWRAGYVEGVNGGVSPSTEAKAWLESQGFKEVTSSLPDARWAEPGDVALLHKPV